MTAELISLALGILVSLLSLLTPLLRLNGLLSRLNALLDGLSARTGGLEAHVEDLSDRLHRAEAELSGLRESVFHAHHRLDEMAQKRGERP